MKKLILTTILSGLVGLIYSQTSTTINLDNNATLTLQREPFDFKKHRIEYDKEEYAITIDGKPIFGTDNKLPRTILNKATLKIESKTYDLQVDSMFDPWVGDRPESNSFRFQKEGQRLRLTARFSDGAGTYAAEWIIINNTSLRTILSNDEIITITYFER